MKWIDTIRTRLFFKLFYLCVRTGMGLTFIISGIRKMPGIDFTALPLDNPVGAYFHAMHETGFYWHFIGYFQIAIGMLVFFNRYVVLSGMLMMPVTVNIFLISVSLGMTGTPYITTVMVAGNLFLMLWHYENFMPVVRRPVHRTSLRATNTAQE
jgi:hypothetical protein